MTRRFRLALSGAFAALTAVLCVLYVQEVRADAERQRAEALERFGGETVRLVVATRGIEAGETLTPQCVAERDWVADLAPAGAFTVLDDAVDRKVTVPVAEGAPLTELNFRDEAEMPEVPTGYMAVQIPMGEKLGLPEAVAAGTRLVAYRVADEGTRLISGDVKVLVGVSAGATYASRGSVSLAVSPDDVADILAASAEGSLRLVVPAIDVEGDPVSTAPTQVGAEEPAAEADEAGAR